MDADPSVPRRGIATAPWIGAVLHALRVSPPASAPVRLHRLRHLLAWLGQRVEQAVLALCGLLLLYLTAALFLQIVFRYLLERPLAWSEESARYAMVWFAMLSAAVTARRGLHVRFTVLLALLARGEARFWILQSYNVVIAGFLLLVLLQSLTYLEIVSNQVAIATNLNMRIPYGGITIGAAALLFVYALDIADGMLARLIGDASPNGD